LFSSRLVFSGSFIPSRRCGLLRRRRGLSLGLVLGFIEDVEIMLIIPLA